MYYFYEGRTLRGVGLVSWALLILLATAVVSGVTEALLGLAYPALLNNPTNLFGPLAGVFAALCLTFLAEVAAAITFLVGFFQVHQGRHEYGLEQSRSIDRALIFLVVFIVLSAVSTVLTSAGGIILGAAGPSSLTAFLPALVLDPVVAFFAGWALTDTVRGVASPAVQSRLRMALVLGVIGAAVGPTLTLLASAAASPTLAQVSTGIIAAAIGGQGVSALSLLLFWLAYYEAYRSLEAGKPAPVLPRIEQVYPWLYAPWIPSPSPPPSPPSQPPKT